MALHDVHRWRRVWLYFGLPGTAFAAIEENLLTLVYRAGARCIQ